MQASILQELVRVPLQQAKIRQTRQNAIIDITTSLLNNSTLTLTSLGRHMKGEAYTKHKIKRVDRWLGSTGLYSQLLEIYKAIFSSLLLKRKTLFIIVDWSGCCNVLECCLRASLLYDGRAITVYQEVHSTHEQQKPEVHIQFLKNLSNVIPSECNVTLITDRGFQVQWFNAVLAQGWNFIGRISKNHHCKLGNNNWQTLPELYSTATQKPTYLGVGKIGKTLKAPLQVYFYSYKGKKKRRKFKKARNKPVNQLMQKTYREQHKTPWILITSLSPTHLNAEQIVKMYGCRMQIEQNFRDDKSDRWGFGMQYHRTRNKMRIALLLMFAAIASYVLLIIGVTAERKGIHKSLQANTCKQRVLSFLFIAKEVIRDIKITFLLEEIMNTFDFVAERSRISW